GDRLPRRRLRRRPVRGVLVRHGSAARQLAPRGTMAAGYGPPAPRVGIPQLAARRRAHLRLDQAPGGMTSQGLPDTSQVWKLDIPRAFNSGVRGGSGW